MYKEICVCLTKANAVHVILNSYTSNSINIRQINPIAKTAITFSLHLNILNV